MIEQTFYLALAANFLFLNPWWQDATRPDWQDNPNYDHTQRPVMPSDKQQDDRELWDAWCDEVDAWDLANPKQHQTNLIAHKPFTCMYCMTFWMGIVSGVLIPFLFGGTLYLGLCFTAPVLALIVSQVIAKLGVQI